MRKQKGIWQQTLFTEHANREMELFTLEDALWPVQDVTLRLLASNRPQRVTQLCGDSLSSIPLFFFFPNRVIVSHLALPSISRETIYRETIYPTEMPSPHGEIRPSFNFSAP